MASSAKLTLSQAHALLNILSHHEIYAEIESFKVPTAIHEYGPPFQTEHGVVSASPALQSLFTDFVLPLPGLRDVDPAFWPDRVLPFIAALSSANLSESYDKGNIGQRRTLSTAISALLEYPVRGYFAKYPQRPSLEKDKDGKDILPDIPSEVWKEFLNQLVYGDLIDEVVKRTAETDKLAEHAPLVQKVHKYIVLNLASLMHYTLVVSPKGPALLALLESAHKLIPYTIIRQTLKIGNAATMISGMVKIVLAKASVGAITNWLGVSQGAAEGMNLLQTIISTVLGWDNRKLKNRASQIEKAKDGPSKDQFKALKEYTTKSQEEQEGTRARSKSESVSIVSAILSSTSANKVSLELTPKQHAMAMEYLMLVLSIRDREQLVEVLCHHNPDLLTPICRDLVTAYDPVIRAIHNAVDLSGTVSDAEAFINDVIKLSKPSSGSTKQPSVEDFVLLLEKHQQSSHRFVHQLAKNGKEVTELYRQYLHSIASKFRMPSGEHVTGEATQRGAGLLHAELDSSFASLSESEQHSIIRDLDSHEQYLSSLSSSSTARTKDVMSQKKSTAYGPGMYLARWQTLLDATKITPADRKGPVRSGENADVRNAARIDVDGKKKGEDETNKAAGQDTPEAPNVALTVRLLGDKFWETLRMYKKIDVT